MREAYMDDMYYVYDMELTLIEVCNGVDVLKYSDNDDVIISKIRLEK